MSDVIVEPYAILSHTWGEDEVCFQDWQTVPSSTVESKEGFKKLKYCLEQAWGDGIEWVWIDTCCIDKTSSAELSEAINSMFRWYQNAVVCYVYLSDITSSVTQSPIEQRLHQSRWFTRGWCLQELIAPANLVFYSQDWHQLGTKSKLCALISSITGIEEAFLSGRNLDMASIGKKMSWAAYRKTSRTEDMAYCLLGIFGVHMSLIYGEGKKAFLRLQEAIMNTYPHDHTLFAWGEWVEESSILISDPELLLGVKRVPWSSQNAQSNLLGLLAESPRDFASSASLVPSMKASYLYKGSVARNFPIIIGKGIRVELPWSNPIIHGYYARSIYHWNRLQITQSRNYKILYLFCNRGDNIRTLVGLPLQGWGDVTWGRTRELIEVKNMDVMAVANLLTGPIHIEPQLRMPLQRNDVVFRHIPPPHGWKLTYHDPPNSPGQFFVEEQILRIDGDHSGSLMVANFSNNINGPPPHRGFGITFGRVRGKRNTLGSVSLRFIPIIFGLVIHDKRPRKVEIDGITWFHQYAFAENLLEENLTDHRVMAIPRDECTWTLDTEEFPEVLVQVERMALDDKCSFIDVIDVVIR